MTEPIEEGGDPACWLHLFEDELEDDQDHPRADDPTEAPPADD